MCSSAGRNALAPNPPQVFYTLNSTARYFLQRLDQAHTFQIDYYLSGVPKGGGQNGSFWPFSTKSLMRRECLLSVKSIELAALNRYRSAPPKGLRLDWGRLLSALIFRTLILSRQSSF
jgi:hypothetical protein